MNVLFVVMPFGAIRPAIGVSLLQAQLETIRITSRILYLNMRFAQRVAPEDYHYVAELAPSQSLAGDWVFAESLCTERGDADAQYLGTFTRRFSTFRASDSAVATLRRCRRHAEPFLRDVVEDVDWQAYDVVAFTSTFTQHAAALALAKRVKERFPDKTIVFGGANCEDAMGLQTHRSFPFVDYVCGGEADISFPRLLSALRDGGDAAKIPGVIARDGVESRFVSLSPERVKSMDDLPYPRYDDYFEQLAAIRPRPRNSWGVLMETSRGCWWGEKHHCTFCGLNGTSMAFRSKSAGRVLAEIEELSRRHQPEYVEMVDNILDMHYFRDLIPELKRRDLKLGLFYETKANLTKEQIREMREAGIATIQPGIESLSSDVLRLMRKGTSSVQNVQLLKWCREFGVRVYWNLIYGFPGEQADDYVTTAETIRSLYHLQPPHGVGAIRLDRFSPNYTNAAQLGVVNVRPDRSYRYVYALADEALAEIAYYFEHDYADGRDPESYVNPTRSAAVQWHANSGSRGLLYADHGTDLAIWDFRADAVRTVTILNGFERLVYLFCDQNRPFQAIQRHLEERGCATDRLEAFLSEVTEARTMVCLDGHYLSLAVSADLMAKYDPASKARTEGSKDHYVL
jgi:ribosomal peptide maturation radical SAM protein 1